MKLFFLMLLAGHMPCSGASGEQKYWKHGDPWPTFLPDPRMQAVVRSSATCKNEQCTFSYTVIASTENHWPILSFQIALTSGMPVIQAGPAGWPTWKQYPGDWSPHLAGLGGNSIQPGQTVSGFILASTSAVPGIAEFYLAIDLTAFDYFEGVRGVLSKERLKEVEFYSSQELTNELAQKGNVSGKTIVPTIASSQLSVGAWTARMSSDASEARKLGWIQTDEQLVKIQSLIGALNTDNKRRLKKAVSEIERYVLAERQAGRLTDEADALVRLNALYLLQRAERDPNILRRK